MLRTNKEMTTQCSRHPRGILISFTDDFAPHEEKTYRFEEVPKKLEDQNSRVAYIGSERVQDIINDYDTVTYQQPYTLENDFFKIDYRVKSGILSFYNKAQGYEMLSEGDARFFTPIYEHTEIRTNPYEERRLLGRNIRGLHAEKHIGTLNEIKILEHGSLFTTAELIYTLPGTIFNSVRIRLYHALPYIEFAYKIAKTINEEPESIYLPLTLNIPNATRYFDKGDVAFRPGIDQVPGSCMEYYLLDNGIVYETPSHSLLIRLMDTPMVYMGELTHHPILLCDNNPAYNKRDIYSWVMNNLWEINFKIDLSGFAEFSYSLQIIPTSSVHESYKKMKETDAVITFMTD